LTKRQPLIIDLNCDLGELPEMLADGREAALMECITSANVACGGHAGDARTMAACVGLAIENDVKIGAHPSYPDRENFGRKRIEISESELERSIATQIAALAEAATRSGTVLSHVKPHGALYHAADTDQQVARTVGRAARSVSPAFTLVGPTGSRALDTWREMGLAVAGEAFADRVYEADGKLRSRDRAGSLIHDAEQAALQAWTIAHERKVIAADNSEIPLQAETICIHGDTPGAVTIAHAVRKRLTA